MNSTAAAPIRFGRGAFLIKAKAIAIRRVGGGTDEAQLEILAKRMGF